MIYDATKSFSVTLYFDAIRASWGIGMLRTIKVLEAIYWECKTLCIAKTDQEKGRIGDL